VQSSPVTASYPFKVFIIPTLDGHPIWDHTVRLRLCRALLPLLVLLELQVLLRLRVYASRSNRFLLRSGVR